MAQTQRTGAKASSTPPAADAGAMPATDAQADAGVPAGVTVRQLEDENAELRAQLADRDGQDDGAPAADRIRQLEAENAELRERTGQTRRAPRPPSFGISEGVRLDVEQNGKATDPSTGRVVTRADLEK